MTDNQIEWLRKMYDDEISQSLSAAQNEHLWAIGSETTNEATDHENNCEELKQYVEILRQLKENIQKG